MKDSAACWGKTFVFKNLRNKTIVATYTKPSKAQSDAQKENRSKFREAANWAQVTLLDPERKAYYQKKAKKLGLPNAYTAAITDYMRKPRTTTVKKGHEVTTYCVYKKDFAIAQTEVQTTTSDGTVQTRIIRANAFGECHVQLNDLENVQLLVTDTTGRTKLVLLKWNSSQKCFLNHIGTIET